MLDESDFESIKAGMESFDEKREAIIKESRDILKLSKQAIYSVHRDELHQARKQLEEAVKVKVRLEGQIANDRALRTGGFSDALAEYVEAATLLHFIEHHKVLPRRDLNVEADEYLLGLADLTGELGRRAVIAATHHDLKQVALIRECVERIYGQFVKFDFRNGELRRKYDAIKYNLQKIERILYDLNLEKRGSSEAQDE